MRPWKDRKMNEPQQVERGGLHFTRSGVGGMVITCTVGRPGEPETEHVFCVHQDWLPAMIAGLAAMQHDTRPKKEEGKR